HTYSGFGISSHCPDYTATLEAVKKGARVIENHVKESKDDVGCDMESSLTFEEYKILLESINAIHPA
ncbi:N-acetylneuraminate synthase family protein, partial [Mycobacteroides chelonae]|uniref:N-acetylneuraminate synthase family protein n=1 Tax=Mycobacteroides chelonae TaxID=1774 RepID=UPI001A965FCE